MVVTEQEDKEFHDVLKAVLSGGIDISELVKEIESGFAHIEDNTYRFENRWTFKYQPNADVILASEEFMRTVVAATHAVSEEWGGLIFGRVIPFKNNCNVFICEKVAIMAQVRGSADFEIKDEHYQQWARTLQFTDFLGAGLARIGWVHSHVNMGCFWSGTDTTTMKQLIEEETNDHIVSVVVSKKADGTLDTKWLTSNRGVHNGIQFRVPEPSTQENPEHMIHYEVEMPSWNNFDENEQAHWKTKMAELTVIERITTYQYGSEYSTASAWQQTRTAAAQPKTLDIPSFMLLVSGADTNLRKILKEEEKWKMKKLVPKLTEELIIKILDFFLKTSNRVQIYLISYHNFDDVATNFLSNLIHHMNKEEKLADVIEQRYGTSMPQLFRSSLVKKTYSVKSSGSTLQKKVEREPDWDEIFFEIDSKYQKGIIDALLSVEGIIFKEMSKKLIESLRWRVNNEEEKWVDVFVTIYLAMNEYRDKYKSDNAREQITKGIEAVLDETFKSFRGSTESTKNALQMVINCLPDDLVMQFMHDFVAVFDTEEELDELYKAGKTTVRKKMFRCNICGNWSPTPKDAKKCEENCKKIGLEKSKKFGEAKPIDSPKTAPKAEGASTQQTTLTETTKSGTGAGIYSAGPFLYGGSHICGMSPNYFDSPYVCKYCGVEYDTETEAKKCEKICLFQIEIEIDDIITHTGYAICPDCGFCFTEMDEYYYAHPNNNNCQMRGMRLHTLLRLYCIQTDIDSNGIHPPKFEPTLESFTELVLNPLYDFTIQSGTALYPNLIHWLTILIMNEKFLWSCEKCGLSFSRFVDPLDGIYQRFYHEKQCKGRGVAPTCGEMLAKEETTKTKIQVPSDYIVIELYYQYRCYWCGLCQFTYGFAHAKDLLEHIENVHEINLDKVVFTVLIGDRDAVKDEYPSWLERRYSVDVPLNHCQFCGKKYEFHTKMEDNVLENFWHEKTCLERFQKPKETKEIIAIDLEGNEIDIDVDAEEAEAEIQEIMVELREDMKGDNKQ